MSPSRGICARDPSKGGTKEKVAEGWRRMGRNNEGDTNGEGEESEWNKGEMRRKEYDIRLDRRKGGFGS